MSGLGFLADESEHWVVHPGAIYGTIVLVLLVVYWAARPFFQTQKTPASPRPKEPNLARSQEPEAKP